MDYGVMMDAGSTGTRIYVYTWPERKDNSVPLVREEMDAVSQKAVSLKVKPGLATFAGNLSALDAYLQPLLTYAVSHVPSEKRAGTRIYCFATAGMRLLLAQDQAAIFARVSSVLSRLPFHFNPSSAAVIDGATEGLYAWVAANFLGGSLGKPPSETMGALDLGGASTQIAFAAGSGNGNDGTTVFPGLYHVEFDGQPYAVYSASFLYYGINEFNRRLQQLATTSRNTSSRSRSGKGDGVYYAPCLPSGYTAPKTILPPALDNGAVVPAVSGSSNYTRCVEDVNTLLGVPEGAKNGSGACRASLDGCRNVARGTTCTCSVESRGQPSIPEGVTFLAMSGYYYSRLRLGLPAIPSAQEQERALRDICALDWTTLLNRVGTPVSEPNTAMSCGTGVLVRQLLQAYNLDGEKTNANVSPHGNENNNNDKKSSLTVDFEVKVNGMEVTWALGAMVLQESLVDISIQPPLPQPPSPQPPQPSPTKDMGYSSAVLAGLGASCVLGGLFLGVVLSKAMRNRRRHSARMDSSSLAYVLLEADAVDG